MALQKALLDSPASYRWRLQLFGPMRLDGPFGVSITLGATIRTRLLALLADQPGKPLNKLEIISQLWPNAEPDAARNCLRIAVHELRKLLQDPGQEGPTLVSDNYTLSLVEGLIETDVFRFEGHLRGARKATDSESKVIHLDAAFKEVRGEFLTGISDPWVLDRRRAIEDRIAEAVTESVEVISHQGEPRRALETARHVLSILRSREEAHVAVMRAYAYLGEEAEAYQQYETLCAILSEEFGISPSVETDRALESLPAPIPIEFRMAPGQEWSAEPVQSRPALVPRFAGSLFVGRDVLVTKLQNWLAPTCEDCSRLVCLTGLSGIGKTRVAAHAGQSMRAEFQDRVWFLSMDGPNDAQDLWRSVALSMGLSTAPGVQPESKAKENLAEGSALLILDDCRHGEALHEEFIESLISEFEDLRILYTSRSRLGFEGERVLRVGPLSVPESRANRNVAQTFESVRLFLDRARSIDPTFSLTARNVGSIVSLCQAVSGHPLAINLAASRVNVCRVEDILERLNDQQGLMARRSKSGPDRHSSLSSAIAWSASTLRDSESEFLARLSTFRQSFTLEAASFVAGEVDRMLDLASLVEAGLVERVQTEPVDRFELLGPVRIFASKSAEHAGLVSESKRRHAEYFSTWSAGIPGLFSENDVHDSVHLISQELSNLLAATRFAVADPDSVGFAIQIVGNLTRYFGLQGHSAEWFSAAKDLLALHGLPEDKSLAEALRTFGIMAFFERQIDQMEVTYAKLKRVAIDQNLGPRYEGIAVNGLALAERYCGHIDEAVTGYKAALAIVDGAGLDDLTAHFNYNLASLYEAEHRFEEARNHYLLTINAASNCENKRFLGLSLDSLGRLDKGVGDLESARLLCNQAIEVLGENGDERAMDYAKSNLSEIELASGNLDEGIRLASLCLDRNLNLREFRSALGNLAVLAEALTTQGQVELASLALQGFRSMIRDLGAVPDESDVRRIEKLEPIMLAVKVKLSKYEDRQTAFMPLLELAQSTVPVRTGVVA